MTTGTSQSDDIVTRLRESNGMTTSRADDGFLSIHPDTDLLRDAADEIERLRKALALAVGELSAYAPYGDTSPEYLYEYFKQAVRGD